MYINKELEIFLTMHHGILGVAAWLAEAPASWLAFGELRYIQKIG